MKIQRIDLEVAKFREDRLKALKESKGNHITYINTFIDLDDTEKAELYDSFMIRKKGKGPKVNPWWDKIAAEKAALPETQETE